MNTPSNPNPLADPAFERAAWWGVAMIAAAILVFLAVVFALPWPLKPVAGLSSMLIICLGVLGFALWLAPRSPALQLMRPAARRYTTRFLPAMIAYALVFMVATWIYKTRHPAGIEAVLLALAPSLPILLAIRAMMRFLKEETDEYLRSRMLESWSLATGFALCVCTVWGFLDQFGAVSHLPLWAAFPIWAVCLFPAQLLLRRRDAS